MQGDDLYWGPSSKSYDAPSTPFKGTSATLTVPDDVELLERVNQKLSYHQSGQFHIKKIQGNQKHEYTSIRQWRTKDKIGQPFRICSIISRTIPFYSEYKKSLIKDNTSALVFRVGDEFVERRHYFEFFISPEGTFLVPAPMLLSKEPLVDQPICFSLNEQYILVIRQLVFPAVDDLNKWHSDKEFVLICDDNDN